MSTRFTPVKSMKSMYLPRVRTRLRVWFQKIKYQHPADPYKFIYINPEQIKHQNGAFESKRGLAQIKGGSWDFERTKLTKNPTYRGLKQRFEEDHDWENTEYKRAKVKYNRGETVLNYDTYEDFINIRCSFVDELYNSMKEEGYKPNNLKDHTVPSTEQRGDSFKHCLEPLVVIGRDGQIILRSGIHRTAIANILNINKIPFQVLGRHRLWQKKRDRMNELEVRDRYQEHPDMKDITS